jgi:two-component system, NarL family, invasion response regulator UvrY
MRAESHASVGVLTVDDHPPFLEVARKVVEATPGFSWAGGVSSGEEALAAADACEPDFVLVDVNMPGMDGIELARVLRRAHPDMLIALISAKDPSELPVAVRRSDPGSVLPKENLRPSWLQEMWRAHTPRARSPDRSD